MKTKEQTAKYSVTRQEIVDAALDLRGWKFRHQARGEANSVDCVGMLYVVLQKLDYPVIIDVEAYRRTPPARLIYETLCANFDEIPLQAVGLGDIYLMRIGGRKPKHTSILVNDETDLVRGIEPEIIHAYGSGNKGAVTVDALVTWLPRCVTGFRLWGLAD